MGKRGLTGANIGKAPFFDSAFMYSTVKAVQTIRETEKTPGVLLPASQPEERRLPHARRTSNYHPQKVVVYVD